MATTVSLNKAHPVLWQGDANELIHQLKQNHKSDFDIYWRIGRSNSVHMQYKQVHAIYKNEQGSHTISLNMPGLFGPLGVLPLFDQKLTAKSPAEVQQATTTFFDIFHHQLSLCAYQSWLNNRLIKSYHLRASQDSNDVESLLMHRFLSGLANTKHVANAIDAFIASSSLLLRKKELSTSVLESLLKAYFTLPLSINNLKGIYQRAEKNDLSYLSAEEFLSALGENSILGETIYVYHNQIEIIIGPLNYQDYQSFLPGGQALNDLKQLIKKLVPFQFEIQVQLILFNEAIPLPRLNQPFVQLGRTAWLPAKDSCQHKQGCVFSIH